MADDTKPAQTSVPSWLMTYCRQLADVHYNRKLHKMYVHMLESFLACAPYRATPPFPWYMAKLHGSTGRKQSPGADPSWVPMNMVLPEKLAAQIDLEIDKINMEGQKMISLRTYLYTAVVWWCSFVYPYEGPGIVKS
jgi:hypothetical protein